MFDRCLYFNSNHLSRVVEKIWKDAYAELDLAPAHAYLLRLVLQQPGLSQRQISEELHLEKSTITRFIDKMVQQGYLLRKQNAEASLREQHIFPAQNAKRIEHRLNEIGDELYGSMQAQINKEDLSILVNLIKHASKSL